MGMNPNAFIKKIAPGAQETMRNCGILSSLTIAQAALESGWGAHAPGNNLFGIKANGWSGRTQVLKTKEYIGGETVVTYQLFRVYSSWAQSVDDHASFLLKHRRYKNVIGVRDYRTACRLIQQDGYATSPEYALVLIGLIEKYQLNLYDTVPAKIHIDEPFNGAIISGKMTVRGWAVDFYGLSRVEIYADKKRKIASVSVFTERQDVQKIVNPYGWYKNAKNSGFICTVPHGTMSQGKHTIDCAGIGRTGHISWASKSVSIS
jgi:hypothetical protein